MLTRLLPIPLTVLSLCEALQTWHAVIQQQHHRDFSIWVHSSLKMLLHHCCHPPRVTVIKVCDNFQTSQCYVKAFHLQPSCLSTVGTWFPAAEGYDGVMISEC